MPKDEETGIPLEILAKGSASNLIKKSRSQSVRRKPAASTPSLWSERKNLDIFTEDLNLILNQAEAPDNNTYQASNNQNNVPSAQNTENSSILSPDEAVNKNCSDNYPDNETDNHGSTGFLRELRQLHFERIFVRTPSSIYFDGILAWVDEEFIILISQRLCIITIPLSSIVSYYILTP